MPSVNYNIKVYKNNYNAIDFVVRNNDRKPVQLINSQLSVVIRNASTRTVVMEKAVVVTDEIKGRAQLVLAPDDTRNWPVGGYEYNIQVVHPNSPAPEFLYLDIANNATGTFQVLESVGGNLIPAQTFLASQFTPVTNDWDAMILTLISGAIPANNQVGNNAGLFSVVVYQQHWKGKFKVQGSLENLAPNEASWFDIPISFDGEVFYFNGSISSPTCFNFAMNLRWIRFVAIPDSVNLGTLDKIIYKIS